MALLHTVLPSVSRTVTMVLPPSAPVEILSWSAGAAWIRVQRASRGEAIRPSVWGPPTVVEAAFGQSALRVVSRRISRKSLAVPSATSRAE